MLGYSEKYPGDSIHLLLASSPGSPRLAHAFLLYDLCTRIKVKTPTITLRARGGEPGDEANSLLHGTTCIKAYRGPGLQQLAKADLA